MVVTLFSPLRSKLTMELTQPYLAQASSSHGFSKTSSFSSALSLCNSLGSCGQEKQGGQIAGMNDPQSCTAHVLTR